MKTLSIGLILLLLSASVWSDENISRATSWSFYMDNDMLSDYLCKKALGCAENQDRSYTGGFGYGLTLNNSYKPSTKIGQWIEEFHDYWESGYDTSIQDEMDEAKVETEVYGFTVFTPGELDDPDNNRPIQPIYGDRPFGDMLFYTSSKVRPYSIDEAIRSDLQLSIIGVNVGRDLQQIIHCELGKGSCPVRGWDNHINTRKDLAFTLGKSKIRAYGKKPCLGTNCERIFEHGWRFGLLTEYFASISYRIGRFDSAFYALNTDPLNADVQFTDIEQKKDRGFVLSASLHAIGYNGQLQGWHLRSDSGPVRYNWDEIEPVVISGLIGYVFPWGESSWMLKVQARSSELDTSLSKDHAWGGIYITVPFDNAKSGGGDSPGLAHHY